MTYASTRRPNTSFRVTISRKLVCSQNLSHEHLLEKLLRESRKMSIKTIDEVSFAEGTP